MCCLIIAWCLKQKTSKRLKMVLHTSVLINVHKATRGRVERTNSIDDCSNGLLQNAQRQVNNHTIDSRVSKQ